MLPSKDLFVGGETVYSGELWPMAGNEFCGPQAPKTDASNLGRRRTVATWDVTMLILEVVSPTPALSTWGNGPSSGS